MVNLLSELKRRHIFRVGAAYAVVAWVLLQLVNNLTPALRLPEWASSLVVVLLLVGFPVALIFTWAHQLTPESGASPNASAGRLDWFLASALVVVFGLVSYQQLSSSPSATPTQQQQASTATAAAPISPAQPSGISIAVLPFANLSGDAAQEFFSDGMAEEINGALAKVQSLRMVGRSSAFQFKGQNRDLRAIGQALGARYLIDGSVRKEGNRVRIAAQLVQADNGVSVWTESYDRELTSVFTTQEDIAKAIASALRVPLGLQQGELLVSNRSIDPESYEQYLRAKALVRSRALRSLTEAAALLEQVVARHPDYAPAWALLALAYGVTPNQHPAFRSGLVDEARRVVVASLPKSEAAAQRAIQLDPNHADGYVSLGFEQADTRRLLQAEGTLRHALALDPNNPDALHRYGLLLAQVGRLKEALPLRQQLHALEPFGFDGPTARILWADGQTDAATAIFKGLPAGAVDLARINAEAGRYSEAADTLLKIPSGIYLPGISDTAARLLCAAPTPATSPQTLPRLGSLGFVYLHIGAPSRALEFYEDAIDIGFLGAADSILLWHPSYAPVRKTERFKTFARKAGLVEYWRARGWPDLCRPVGADDFVCD